MTIELRNVSRWYGNVVAVNDVTMSIGPGVTGLLGPNGAGKSTIMHMIAGFLPPSRGELTVAGGHSWHNPEIYRTVGLVPERDSVYAFLTGEQFVTATAKLHQLADPAAAAGGPSPCSTWPTRRTARSPPTPRACGSASRSPPRSCTTRRSCCSTSRSTAWTRASGCT